MHSTIPPYCTEPTRPRCKQDYFGLQFQKIPELVEIVQEELLDRFIPKISSENILVRCYFVWLEGSCCKTLNNLNDLTQPITKQTKQWR